MLVVGKLIITSVTASTFNYFRSTIKQSIGMRTWMRC